MARINSLSGGFTGYTSVTAPSKEEPEYIGSIMAFAQTTAPTGWVKETSYNDYAIRIVSNASGTPGTGGTVNASSVFTTQIPFSAWNGPFPFTVGTTTMTTSQMQPHTHAMGYASGGGTLRGGTPSTAPYWTGPYSASGSQVPLTSVSAGSGGGHGHTAGIDSIVFSSSLNLSVKYLDVIMAKY